MKAIETLKNIDLKTQLTQMARQQPTAFRQLLGLSFEPNTLKMRTERRGRNWAAVIEDYKLTEAVQEFDLLSKSDNINIITSSSGTKRCSLV